MADTCPPEVVGWICGVLGSDMMRRQDSRGSGGRPEPDMRGRPGVGRDNRIPERGRHEIDSRGLHRPEFGGHRDGRPGPGSRGPPRPEGPGRGPGWQDMGGRPGRPDSDMRWREGESRIPSRQDIPPRGRQEMSSRRETDSHRVGRGPEADVRGMRGLEGDNRGRMSGDGRVRSMVSTSAPAQTRSSGESSKDPLKMAGQKSNIKLTLKVKLSFCLCCRNCLHVIGVEDSKAVYILCSGSHSTPVS